MDSRIGATFSSSRTPKICGALHSTAASRRPPLVAVVFLRRVLRLLLVVVLALLLSLLPRSRFLLRLRLVAALLFTVLRPNPRIMEEEEGEGEEKGEDVAGEGPSPRRFFKAATRGRTFFNK